MNFAKRSQFAVRAFRVAARAGWAKLGACGLVLGALFGPVQALAANHDCDASQGAMNACAEKDAEASEAKLNRVYQKLMKKTEEGKNKARLREAEKAWLVYREKHCDFATAAAEGGSVRPLLLSQCYKGVTDARINELEAELECAGQEGDLGCYGR